MSRQATRKANTGRKPIDNNKLETAHMFGVTRVLLDRCLRALDLKYAVQTFYLRLEESCFIVSDTSKAKPSLIGVLLQLQAFFSSRISHSKWLVIRSGNTPNKVLTRPWIYPVYKVEATIFTQQNCNIPLPNKCGGISLLISTERYFTLVTDACSYNSGRRPRSRICTPVVSPYAALLFVHT